MPDTPSVADSPDVPRLNVVARRRAMTLEGRLSRGTVGHPYAIAGLYAVLITLGEVSTVFVHPTAGILVHAFTFILMLAHSTILRGTQPSLFRLIVALTPVPLIRIASLTSPLAQFSFVQWFTILSVILYAGIVMAIKLLKPDLASIGLKLSAREHWPIELVVIACGFGLGFAEYLILRPGALIPSFTVRNLIGPIIVIYVATGLLEEILFRGIIQRYASEALGSWAGIAFATILFAVMHVGWKSWLDIVFVAAVGGLYALVVRRTGSIVAVSISHGITNVMLLLVMPFQHV